MAAPEQGERVRPVKKLENIPVLNVRVVDF